VSNNLMRKLRPALTLVVLMTLLLGIVYPMAVTALSRILFPAQAAGSLLRDGQTLIGSRLIGQHFAEAKYFWGRPSATTPQPYNGMASGGSNLGPSNPALLDQVDANIQLLKDQAVHTGAVPVELVTGSGSGLDPHISVAGAQYQVARIANARHMAPDAVRALIDRLQSGPLLGVIGESQVNVLELNMALDHAPAPRSR
jgi:K+-transporting ATPase ATPase C chain